MNELPPGKGSSPSVIAAYRKRQERAERLLLVFWIGIMLLIIGAGYFIYRLMNSDNGPQTQAATETPAQSTTMPPGTPAPTTPVPTASGLLDLTVTPESSATPAGPTYMTYAVQQGDTLISIAIQFGVDLNTLTALNPLVTPEFLSVGDQLSIPVQAESLATATLASTGSQSILEYQVVNGDTLAAIAVRFGSSIDAIVSENNLASPDEIYIGQNLRIPVEAGVTAATSQASPTPEASATATPPE